MIALWLYDLLDISTERMGPLKALVSVAGAFDVVLIRDDRCLPTEVMI